MLAANLFVDAAADYTITLDQGATGIDAGDTVSWNGPAPVAGLTFGTSAFSSLQAAIDAASPGDTISLAAGTYSENVTVGKRLTIVGVGSGADPATNTVLASAAASRPVVQYGAGGLDVTNRQVLRSVRVTGASGGAGNNNSGILITGGSMGFFTFDDVVAAGNTGSGLVSNVAPAASLLSDVVIQNSSFSGNGANGIRTASHSVDGFTLTNSSVQNNAALGLAFNSSDNSTAQIGGVSLSGVTFGGNNNVADLYAFRMLGSMSLTNVDFTGSKGSGLFGLYLLGGYVNQASAPAIGTVTLNDVTVSGTYTSAGISFLGYSTLANVSMTDVVLNTQVPTANRGHIRLSGVAGTLNVGNTAFNTTTAPLDIRMNDNFGAAGSVSTVRVDATNATFSGKTGAAMTLSERFAEADRIQDGVDGGTGMGGLVTIVAGGVFVTPNSFASLATTASVQRAVSLASAGDIVWVQAGAYASAAATATANNLTVNVPTGVTGFTGVVLGAGVADGTLAGTGASTLTGNAIANLLVGNDGNDSLAGLEDDDTLTGAGGSNVLDGGLGTDTATFAGNYADYTLAFSGSSVVVTRVSGGSSVDSVTKVEKLSFADRTLIVVGTAVGSQYTAIGQGVAAAGDGDVVLVAPGTYAETVSVTQSHLTIQGPNASITGSGTRVAEAVVTGGFVVDGVSTVEISGFDISGSNGTGSGVLVGNNTAVPGPVTVANNVIGGWSAGISLAGGVTAGWVTNATISGNLIRNNTAGIGSTENVTGLAVTGNTFSGNVAGIRLGQGLTGLSVAGNSFAASNTVQIAASAPGLMPAYTTLYATNTFSAAAGVSATTGADSTTQAIYGTIIDAVDNAAADATIQLSAGEYLLTSSVTLGRSLSILGPNAAISPVTALNARAGEAVINGGTVGPFDGSGFAFTLASGITSLTVRGVTLTNFDGNVFTSSIVPVASVDLMNNIFTANNGGLFSKFDTSVATVFDVRGNLITNHSMSGGSNTALFFLGNVANSAFDGNQATNVAGRELFNVYHTLSNTSFTGNLLVNTAGLAGLYANQSDVVIHGNTLTNTTIAGGAAIYVSTFSGKSVGHLEITGNTITTVSGASGIILTTDAAASSISDVLIEGNSISGTLYGVSVDTVANGNGTVSAVTIRDNDFTDNSFSPILVYSRVNTGGGLNAVRDVTIEDNAFVANASIYTSSFYLLDFRNVSGANSFSRNSVTFSGSLPSGTDALRAVAIRGSRTGTWNVVGNSLDGGGVAHNNSPTVFVSGIAILTEDGTTGNLSPGTVINVTGNIIRDFEDGIVVRDGVSPSAYGNIPAGVLVNVTNNDLSGNALFAIRTGADGASMNASGNWWGASAEAAVVAEISGAANVDFSPYLGTGANSVISGPGFDGDFSDVWVTSLGVQVGSTGRVQEGMNLVTTGGTLNVNAGAYADGAVTVDTADLAVDAAAGVSGFSFTLVTANSLTLTGAGNVAITGNANANTLTGNAGENILAGLVGNDTIAGGAENDTLSGGGGTNVLDGGSGLDTATYTGNYADYTVTVTGVAPAQVITVVDNRPGSPDGTDTITNIERLQFADRTVNPLGLTLAIASSSSSLNATETAEIAFSLSSASTTFTVDDVVVTGGMLSGFGGSGDFYTATFTPAAGFVGSATVTVPAGSFTDDVGTSNSEGVLSPPITIDAVAPSLVITATAATVGFGQSATLAFALTKPAVGFEAAVVEVSGGTLSGFTMVTSTAYTAVFTPLASFSGPGTVTVPAGAFTDAAGNPNLAAALDPPLSVDTVQPTVTISSDRGTLAAGQTAVVTFSFSQPAAGFISRNVDVSGGTLSPLTAVDATTFTGIFTPTPGFRGAGTVSVAAGAFTTASGNPNLPGSLPAPLVIATQRPSVTIVADAATLLFGQTAGLTFVLDAPAADFTAESIVVSGGTLTDFAGTGRLYTATFVPAVAFRGAGTVAVPAAAFSDAFGNRNLAGGLTPALSIDTLRPRVTVTASQTALAAGDSATITFSLSQASTTFSLADVVVTGGALRNFSGSGKLYVATFVPQPNVVGTGTVDVPEATFVGGAGNPNTAGGLSTPLSIDTVRPTVTITADTPTLAIGQTATITFVVSRPTVSFRPVQVVVTGGTLSNFSGSGTSYTALFTPRAGFAGNASVSVPSNAFRSTAGSLNVAGSITSPIAVDTVRPTVRITSSTSSLRAGQAAAVTFALGRASADFTVGDVTVRGGTLSDFTGAGSVYTALFTPLAGFVGAGVVEVAAGAFTSTVGNANLAGDLAPRISIDTVLPTVTVTAGRRNLAVGETSRLTFTLDRPSTTFRPGIIGVTGGTLSQFQGTGRSYTALFTPQPNFTGQGTVTVPAGSFLSTTGNANVFSALATPLAIDTVRPTVTIATSLAALGPGETATITFLLGRSSETFTAADVTVTGGSLSGFTGSGSTYSATFTPRANFRGQGTVTVPAGRFTGPTGSPNRAGALPVPIEIDTLPQVVSAGLETIPPARRLFLRWWR